MDIFMPILASRPKTSSQFKKRPAEHIDSKKPYQNTWAKIQPNITKNSSNTSLLPSPWVADLAEDDVQKTCQSGITWLRGWRPSKSRPCVKPCFCFAETNQGWIITREFSKRPTTHSTSEKRVGMGSNSPFGTQDNAQTLECCLTKCQGKLAR